ncbi:VIT1/CCC1 transporter family protein [Actinomyces vulturis]|uniref:VIT1/CCC1 transporter family protein n=1 Tax=Actinomyces vulturis TaxID=1857645 RepID=UPI001C3FFD1D|nr:VIT family protein [Actinomyces vulturis]
MSITLPMPMSISSPTSATETSTQQSAVSSRLNWLRAGVLGANDGICSTAGLVVGVAAADPTNTKAIMAAGVAGLLAGAAAMATGEYVSVSTQRDTEKALVEKSRSALRTSPDAACARLAAIYRSKGLSPATAMTVARELTAHDALGAHLEAEFGIREDDYTNPLHAAISSAISFILGAMVPLLAIVLLPVNIQIPGTFGVVMAGLALTGYISARLGSAPPTRAVVRLMAGGAAAMLITWWIGHLIGVAV